MDCGQPPNAEIVQKKADAWLLFLALLMCLEYMLPQQHNNNNVINTNIRIFIVA